MEAWILREGGDGVSVCVPETGCSFEEFTQLADEAMGGGSGAWEWVVEGAVWAMEGGEDVRAALLDAGLRVEARVKAWYAARVRLQREYGEEVPLTGDGGERKDDDDSCRTPSTMLRDALRVCDVERARCVLLSGLATEADIMRAAHPPLRWIYNAAAPPSEPYPARMVALTEAGVEPNLSTVTWHTLATWSTVSLLAYYITGSAFEAAAALIERGACVHGVGTEAERTPLMAAMRCYPAPPPPAFVELLLAHGADPNRRDPAGKTPLHALLETEIDAHEDDDIFDDVFDGVVDVDTLAASMPDGGCTPWSDVVGVADTLLAAGADINAKDKDGVTPLGALTVCRWWPLNRDLCRALVARGADATYALCLMLSENLRWLPTIKMLLEEGADVNGQLCIDKSHLGKQLRSTPLTTFAAFDAEVDPALTRAALEVLLAYGADPNLPDISQDDAPPQLPLDVLHVAGGVSEALLLEAGAVRSF